jgi:hypothetical protein
VVQNLAALKRIKGFGFEKVAPPQVSVYATSSKYVHIVVEISSEVSMKGDLCSNAGM